MCSAGAMASPRGAERQVIFDQGEARTDVDIEAGSFLGGQPCLLQSDSGVAGERPDRRIQVRPETCHKIGATLIRAKIGAARAKFVEEADFEGPQQPQGP